MSSSITSVRHRLRPRESHAVFVVGFDGMSRPVLPEFPTSKRDTANGVQELKLSSHRLNTRRPRGLSMPFLIMQLRCYFALARLLDFKAPGGMGQA